MPSFQVKYQCSRKYLYSCTCALEEVEEKQEGNGRKEKSPDIDILCSQPFVRHKNATHCHKRMWPREKACSNSHNITLCVDDDNIWRKKNCLHYLSLQ